MIEYNQMSIIDDTNKTSSPKLNPQVLKYINDKLDNIETKIFNKNSDYILLPKTHFDKPLNSNFNEFCSICSSPIYYQKYICCFCNNTICSSCEPSHNYHPLYKLSSNSLHTINSLKQYIQSQTNDNFPSDTHSYSKINVETFSNKFSMRRNQKIILTIKITNTSHQEILNNELFIIATGGKDLNIPLIRIKEHFDINESKVFKMSITSMLECKLYTIGIEVYSKEDDIEVKYVNGNKVMIEVNNDYEEDELNQRFKNEEEVVVLSKEKKMLLNNLAIGVNSKIVTLGEGVPLIFKNPLYLLKKLTNAKWNVEYALSVIVKEMANRNNI